MRRGRCGAPSFALERDGVRASARAPLRRACFAARGGGEGAGPSRHGLQQLVPGGAGPRDEKDASVFVKRTGDPYGGDDAEREVEEVMCDGVVHGMFLFVFLLFRGFQ